MTSPNPMALEAKALEAAVKAVAYEISSYRGERPNHVRPLAGGIENWESYKDLARSILSLPALAALPPPAAEAAWTPEKYAEQLAVSIRQRCYPEVPQFEPMTGDIMGLLSQIDNMSAGMVRALPPPAAGEGLEPVAWQPGEQGLAVRALINLLAKLSTSPDNADYCLWLERIVAVLTTTPAVLSAVLEPSALKAIDSQVLTAAQSMEKEQREQPEWVWHANDGPGRTSYGRWQKLPHQAPYIRADLVLRALKEKT